MDRTESRSVANIVLAMVRETRGSLLEAAMRRERMDARVDAYVETAAEFAQPVLGHLRGLVHRACGEVEETVKWSRPFFVYRGEIVANMAAFKAHCSFGLWGPGMSEVLRFAGVKGDEASGSLGRLTCLADLPSDAELLSWLRTAFASAGERGRVSRVRTRSGPVDHTKAAKGELVVPEDLVCALEVISGAADHFLRMSPSCRKEYVLWIEEAKRPETRSRRIREAAAWIGEGKRRNWKYEAAPREVS